jgi:hypothetical protein
MRGRSAEEAGNDSAEENEGSEQGRPTDHLVLDYPVHETVNILAMAAQVERTAGSGAMFPCAPREQRWQALFVREARLVAVD